MAQTVKNMPAVPNLGDLGWIPGSGRSPGKENGNPFQYSCLENPMDRGAWGTTVLGSQKSWTQLNDWSIYTHMLLVNLTQLGIFSVRLALQGAKEEKGDFRYFRLLFKTKEITVVS